MNARALVEGYVWLDRSLLFRLQNDRELTSAFQGVLDAVSTLLEKRGAWDDLENLCQAGCEREEVLWLLGGCDGVPGITSSEGLFGRGADELRKNLRDIRHAADVISNLNRQPFGHLLRGSISLGSLPDLPEHLRLYAAAVGAAQADFVGSDWYLNIAKARLSDHVTYKTDAGRTRKRDKEISSLIGAITNTSYGADAHRRWRHQHNDLLGNRTTDPDGRWTIDPSATLAATHRDEATLQLKNFAETDPDFNEYLNRCASTFLKIAQSRFAA